jgi:hypothetical protein
MSVTQEDRRFVGSDDEPPRSLAGEETDEPVEDIELPDEQDLRQVILDDQAMMATFTSRGWSFLVAWIEAEKLKCYTALGSAGAAPTMDVVAAYRGRLVVLDGLLSKPGETAERLAANKNLLAEMVGEDEQGDG